MIFFYKSINSTCKNLLHLKELSNMTRPLSQEKRQAIKRLLRKREKLTNRKRWSDERIAKRLGVSRTSVLRIRRSLKIPAPRSRVPPEVIKEIKRLIRGGELVDEKIAERINEGHERARVSKSTVFLIRQSMKVSSLGARRREEINQLVQSGEWARNRMRRYERANNGGKS